MSKYDTTHFNPPAPIAHVILRNMQTGAQITDVILLLDTGADITLLPRRAVEQLGIQPLIGQDYQLQGFDGSITSAQAVELDMIFLKKAYRGEYVLIDDNHGVLGRDVLANIVLILDGPEQEWSELSSRP
jgi:predicted aspartyl protease